MYINVGICCMQRRLMMAATKLQHHDDEHTSKETEQEEVENLQFLIFITLPPSLLSSFIEISL
jgi:hypothetical protein